jgi:hypothetical protein
MLASFLKEYESKVSFIVIVVVILKVFYFAYESVNINYFAIIN